MIILGIDTSTDSLMVSLISEKKILASCNSIGTLKHSSNLFPSIQKALKKIDAEVEDIDLVAIGLGPGSFTGLRVGITAARGLAIALGRPIVGVPTMDAIALNGFSHLNTKKLNKKYKKVCVIIDAKKAQVYDCIYNPDGDRMIKEGDYRLEPFDVLSKRLKGGVFFLGDAAHTYKTDILKIKGIKAGFLKGRGWLPKGSTIARIAYSEFMNGRRDDPYDLTPLYLYERDCNVRRD